MRVLGSKMKNNFEDEIEINKDDLADQTNKEKDAEQARLKLSQHWGGNNTKDNLKSSVLGKSGANLQPMSP